MTSRILAVAIMGALVAGSALAQTPIRLGQSLNGSLSAASPKADDGTPYDLYTYRGRAGDRVRIRMDSASFDAYLAAGTTAAPGCSDDCVYNDDGGGGTNSLLTATVPASGVLQIRANSIGANDAGSYTLSVTEAPAAPRPSLRQVSLNTPTQGRLGEDSPQDENSGQPYDIWLVKGRGGQTVRISLDANEFDPVLGYGTWSNGQFLETASDDDGGPGLNSRLTVTLPASGEAAIRLASIGSGANGTFTVTVGEPPAPRPIVFQTAKVGEAIRGKLDDSDAFTPDEEMPFDAYRIEGRPGQRVEVRMDSSDFDPILKWGVFDGDTFHQEAQDDDGGGGTSARLIVTLDADGEGRLVAASLDGSKGSYTMSLVTAARGSD
ncbi:hypothetical protein [Pseudofulvimonas gallinarii]|jgi:hypothetical protein|uniref:Pre-peptidase n=1 Tax=Pseudofulvimonas gallinarii TaxID=634155 RepID=A0A4S3KVV4_9GAMM|nr:hypothetical protein [Pseudofulvimonas gallinarii]TCS93763.1 hypothetical protein EDC25_12518 [Pseudofulvimonas gallinarii]THD13266.1 hypothetical protein B1808_08995 [Pseudofulvimonas gallinarii]